MDLQQKRHLLILTAKFVSGTLFWMAMFAIIIGGGHLLYAWYLDVPLAQVVGR